jgi:hypothetical protein
MDIQVLVQLDLPLSTEHLCCPCPWNWLFFEGDCYFSKSKKSWTNSVAAFQEMETQLVVIKSDEEQVFVVGGPMLVWDVYLTTGNLGGDGCLGRIFLDEVLFGQVGNQGEER